MSEQLIIYLFIQLFRVSQLSWCQTLQQHEDWNELLLQLAWHRVMVSDYSLACYISYHHSCPGEAKAVTCHPHPWHLSHWSFSQGCRVCQGHSEPGSWWPSSLISNRFPPPGSTGITSSPTALQSANSYCHITENSRGPKLEMNG